MPPVDDHPIHPSTIQKQGTKNGCYNRKPFASSYYAPDRIYRPDGTFYIVLKKIDYCMSTECKYDMADGDPGCEGCQWKH